jgi:sn-glycerol 3-phosphate transport system ATP-binding protein
MRIEIKRIQRSLKTTSVYVTHDQLEAMTLADRLVVMNSGRIEQVGKPVELYERPASLFVAGFIGSPPMNIFEVETLRNLPGVSIPGSLSQKADVVGVRPDAIRLQAPEGDAIAMKGTVELIEPVGGESHVYLRVEGISDIVILVVQGRASFGEGEMVTLHLPAEALHPFDKSTGLRVD